MTVATLRSRSSAWPSVGWLVVALAADRAGRRRLPAARHAAAAGRHGGVVLADDDGGGRGRFGRARPAERHGAGDGGAGRPDHPGAVLGVDGAGARRVRHRRRRERERAGEAGVGARWRGRVRRADRRAVRALSALHRPRDHAGAAGGVRGAQPGRHDAAAAAAAGRGGRGRRHREPGGGAGRRAARRGAARRAARARGVLRRGGRLAAPRCARRDRLQRASRCRRSASRSSGWASAPGVQVSGLPEAVGKHDVDRAGVAGRHHARVRLGRRQRSFPGGATSCSCCVVASIAIHELVGPDPVPPRSGAGRRARRARGPPAGRGVESRAVPPQPGRRRPDHGEGRRPAASPWRSTR